MTTNDESLGLGLLFEPKGKKEEGKLGSWRLLTWNTFHSLMLTSALTLQLSTQLVRCSMWGCSQNTQRVEQPVEFRAARAPLSKATVHSKSQGHQLYCRLLSTTVKSITYCCLSSSKVWLITSQPPEN